MTTSGKRGCRLAAAGKVVTGASHIRANSECQDALAICESGRGFVIAAVADGHGSKACPHSGEGARIAADAAVKLLARIFGEGPEEAKFALSANRDDRIPRQLELMWKEEVRARHAAQGRETADGDALFTLYGTTVTAIGAMPGFAFLLKLGDGDILMVGEGGARPLLADAEKIGEDTESLCLGDAWKYVRTHIVRHDAERPLMFIISTDGYSNCFSDSAGFHKAGEDIFGLWAEEGLGYIEESLENWLRRSSDAGSGDDIALALVAQGLQGS